MNRFASALAATCLAVAGIGAGCSSSPANVAGSYTIAVTDEDNGCGLSNWSQGQSSTNIPVTVSQDDDSATAMVTGAVGGYLDTVLGSSTFTGDLDGDKLALTLYGTRNATKGNCSYTYQADLDGSLSGDTLTGTITYTPVTNGSPDCDTMDVTGCTSVQNFNGTRPPS
jgi:hypothetical protein